MNIFLTQIWLGECNLYLLRELLTLNVYKLNNHTKSESGLYLFTRKLGFNNGYLCSKDRY